MEPVYGELLRIEASHPNAKDGLRASFARLLEVVKSKATSYDELIFAL